MFTNHFTNQPPSFEPQHLRQPTTTVTTVTTVVTAAAQRANGHAVLTALDVVGPGEILRPGLQHHLGRNGWGSPRLDDSFPRQDDENDESTMKI